jgi:hypothetical protein
MAEAGTGVTEVVAAPTGALRFGLLGDGRDGCGGKGKSCSIDLPIAFGAKATIRVGGASRALADTDRPEFTWVPSLPEAGNVKIEYAPTLYCDLTIGLNFV